MNRTSIEWVRNPDGSPGYSWNPITGCLNQEDGLCKGGGFPCYAYKLAHGRLKQRYLANKPDYTGYNAKILSDPFYPRLWEDKRLRPAKGFAAYVRTKPKGVFVCDMGDLFGLGVPEYWTREVLRQCKGFHQWRFYLLTKQPQNLVKFSPFPDNCWVGVTATNRNMLLKAREVFDSPMCAHGIRAKVKFISFEPLLGPAICNHQWETTGGPGFSRRRIDYKTRCVKCGKNKSWGDNSALIGSDGKPIVDWIIIGACTGRLDDMARLVVTYPQLSITHYRGAIKTAQPKIEWVSDIVKAADKAGIPVFLKDNLKPALPPEVPTFYRLAAPDDDHDQRPVLRQEVPA